ncbi:riboflavin biosynthesis protein [Paraoerskovia sediminicola]|uniref:Riboflavin biosynthesis protein n=1 Tax=Paraoerskovia sediminicola TaxID=1138587 RepID=A0ABM8G749_9CELL|nr:bifunctional riboflavin kinase/FAD synthetase [Paraoerskovia sediminicola]BDZ43912.1 riboflavin biosynthesis protein [Paraoerskovia sediminicola]
MNLWTDLDQVPSGYGPSVVTIGNFDGVHRGHGAVLRRIVDLAHAADARAVAVTFHPHPSRIHRPDSAPELITGLADRTRLLAETGLDATLVVEYTLEFARQTPEEFVVAYLSGGLGARTVVVGHDVRFGRDNSGDLSTMVELGRAHGFDVVTVDDVGQEDPPDDVPAGHHRWSSTYVRELLAAGRVRDATEVLGRHHRVRGTVVHGDARGRELGFPTANLGDVQGMVPQDGVYAGWVLRPDLVEADPGNMDAVLPAAISVGTNPTFDGAERRVEAYVLDRTDLDLYDEEIALDLVEHLRPTVRFDGIEPLVAQMHDDVERAREILLPPAGQTAPDQPDLR